MVKEERTASSRFEANGLSVRAREQEPAVTQALQSVLTAHGGQFSGLEHRFKTTDRLQEKIDSGKAPRDALRYTVTFPPDRYMEGTQSLLREMYSKYDTRDEWNKQRWALGDHYQGINTSWKSGGLPFELQIHTPESSSVAKSKASHMLYENWQRATDPIVKAKYANLRLQEEANITNPVPEYMQRRPTWQWALTPYDPFS